MLKQTHGTRLSAKLRLDRFIMSPAGGENPHILPYFGFRNFVVLPVGGILRKLNTGAELQTFPSLSNGIKIVSVLYSNAFMAQTLTVKNVTDKQTNIQV